jgi:hypothetical protein
MAWYLVKHGDNFTFLRVFLLSMNMSDQQAYINMDHDHFLPHLYIFITYTYFTNIMLDIVHCLRLIQTTNRDLAVLQCSDDL